MKKEACMMIERKRREETLGKPRGLLILLLRAPVARQDAGNRTPQETRNCQYRKIICS
jgi:hypothetical protein